VAQAAYYRAEVIGVNSIELQRARAAYMALVGSPARSGSAALGLLAEGDPTWRQGLGPILTWSAICWKAATHPTFSAFIDIPRLGALAGAVVTQLPMTWSSVRGPLGAAHLSLKRVGWSFVTPFVIRSPQGLELALTAHSPALIQYHLTIAWKMQLGRTACKATGISSESQVDASLY
jgi:hypothetical protein